MMHPRKNVFPHVSARRLWLTGLVAFAFILTATLGPGRNIAFAATSGEMSSHVSTMAGDLDKSATASCADHGKMPAKTCDNSGLCMTMCGKLPVQASTMLSLFLREHVSPILPLADTHLVSLSPSPLRRPPRLV